MALRCRGFRGFSCPICGDAAIPSRLHRDGIPGVLTPDVDGASFLRVVADKKRLTRNWLGRINMEMLPPLLAKREADGIIGDDGDP